MTKEWLATGHPKYFKWRGKIWHEDDFFNYVGEQIYGNPEELTEEQRQKLLTDKRRQKLFDSAYNKGIEEAEPLTEEEWNILEEENRKLFEMLRPRKARAKCTRCGSTDTYKRGYRRYKCKKCGHIFRKRL